MMSTKVLLLVVVHLALCQGRTAISKPRPDLPSPPKEVSAVAKRQFCPVGSGDTDAGCPYWRELGFCTPRKGYLDFMEGTCPVTCGFCEARPTPPPKASIIKVDVYSCLRAHNDKRAIHGAPPLTWNWSLMRDAEEWALELANEDKFEHAPWKGQGENLYYISRVTSSPITCADAVQAWYDEVKDYPFNSPPRSLTDVPDLLIGHFTQLVWKDTSEVGVAVSFIQRGLWYSTYVAARYTPPGNHNKQFARMVGRPRRG